MSSSEVEDLFKRFWNWRLISFPEFATFVGEHSYDDRLQSYSLDTIENRKLTVEKYLDEAMQVNLDTCTKKEDKLNLAYFINELTIFIKGQSAKGYYFPLSYLDGVHIEFERLLDTMKKENEDDYIKILKRISALPKQISEIIEILRGGIKNKMTFHLTSVAGILKQLDDLQKPPEETIFFKPFATIPDDMSFSTESKSGLLATAKHVIADDILPAFKNLKSFLLEEYFCHVRPQIAITSLNGGKEFYQFCLYYHLSCNMTPKEIHETGLKEVEKIKGKMKKIIESLELEMSVKDFSDHIRGQKDFCFGNVEELLDTYRGALFKEIEPKLSKLFNYLPKSKLVIALTSSSTPNAPAAYYYAGTFDGSKPGTFSINASDLDALPKYEVMTLALHEGLPGHHFQQSYMIENENVPYFRQYVEDRRYTEAPSLFPLNTAYVEGWGLYSEGLGYELGLYDDPYLEYGHLSHGMLRACRLVVDTGLHAFGWTEDQAIEYMLQHTALHKTDLENEVKRYITWPGQACGYKIGELKIKALRKQAEKALGENFDICEFHDVVLQSYGPLQLLEQRILEYIQSHSS